MTVAPPSVLSRCVSEKSGSYGTENVGLLESDEDTPNPQPVTSSWMAASRYMTFGTAFVLGRFAFGENWRPAEGSRIMSPHQHALRRGF